MSRTTLIFDVLAAPPPSVGLTATYVVPSGPRAGTYVYREADARQLGNYVDPDGAFTMSAATLTLPGVPMQVIFRRAGPWACIIFECCNSRDTVNESMVPAKGDNNTVTITDQTGATLGTVTFWGQWAYARWRWQSMPWPFAKDPAVLRAKKLLPLFDPNVLGGPPRAPTVDPFIPMHIPPGWPRYMAGGGDPCLFSLKQGYWGCYPTAANLQNMLAEAEGLSAYPWFYRDPTTGAVPDYWDMTTIPPGMPYTSPGRVTMSFVGTPGTQLGTRTVTDALGQQWIFDWQPFANIDASGHLSNYGMNGDAYPGNSAPVAPFTIYPADNVTSITCDVSTFVFGSGLTPDEAHSGSMWALPWIATGDPYYLEQIHAKYAFTQPPPITFPRPKLNYGQIRETAWKLASLMMAAATTPAVTPSWLLPRSLWQRLWADEMRLWQSELVGGATPGSTVFHIVGATAGGAQGGLQFATWQEDMILQVMSWASMLMPDCKWAAEWKVQDQIARTNGTSGWSNYAPEAYYLQAGTSDRTTWYQSWSEMWAKNAAAGTVPTPPPTTMWSSEDYCGQLRCGMAFASQAGVGGQALKDCLAAHTARMRAAGYGDQWMRLVAG